MWMLIFLSLVAFCGIIFNGCILMSVVRYRILQKKHYSILVSLAICDMFKALVLVNIVIYSTLKSYQYCVTTSSLGMTFIFETTLHLAAESLNRCLIVQMPYRYTEVVTKRKMAAVIILLWFTPIFVSLILPNILQGTTDLLQFQLHLFGCTLYNADPLNSNGGESYMVLIHVAFFALPLTMMVISYGFVLRMAYKSAGHLRLVHIRKWSSKKSPAVRETVYSNSIICMIQSSYNTASVSAPGKILGPIQHKTRTQSMASKASKDLQRAIKGRKREIKASKTVVVIVLAFLMCNAPLFSVTWSGIADNMSTNSQDLLTRNILVCLAFLQVFVDPIVYFLRLKDYKNARKRIKRAGSTVVRKTIRRLQSS